MSSVCFLDIVVDVTASLCNNFLHTARIGASATTITVARVFDVISVVYILHIALTLRRW